MTRKHSRITLISMLFAVLLLAITPQFTGLLAQEEEAGATQACGASPNQFGGQGFEYAGQGFEYAGQGFEYAGQGFEYAGQGFEYAGQDGTSIVSYTFDEINQQITDNIIDPNWVNIIFDGITDGADYGEANSAIIVLDDTDHGDLVLRTFEVLNQALISNEIQAIPIHFIDISIPSINFEASAIATALEAKVIELQEAGVDHIAVNMSFAFILCEDEETGFSYYEYLETKEIRENAEQNPEIGSAVRPVFECVYEVGNTYVARFGYLNESTDSVGIEIGRNNRLSPNNNRELLPELFEAGRQSDVFEIPFNSRRLVWTLEGDDGVRRTATAGKGRHVPRCEDDSARDYIVIEDDYHGHHAWLWKWLLKWKWNWLNGNNSNQGYVPHWYHDLFRQSHPDTYERREATVGITPVVECVYIVSTIDDNLSLYRAQFGYTNTTDNTIYLPVGSSNMVGNTAIPAQPTYFLPGERQAVFEAEFYSNSSVTWTVLGANGEVTSATASALVDEDEDGIPDNFNICVESEGYTLGDYFAELGLDPDEITSTLIRLLLFQNSDGESLEDDSTLLPLRNLLASFLASNIESENKQTVITFASSGNYAPWFREALGLGVFDPVPPLIPAAWNETIAVAATIGDDVVDTNEDGIADAIGRDNSFDGTQWVMSHDGDLRAPGAGYDISNETEQLAVAGTSFAAPSATVIGALYGRYPHACESVVLANPDGSASYYPPLDVVNSLDSTPLIFGPDNPLRCNIAPNAIDYSFTLDEGVGEGEEGEANVLVGNLLTDNLQDPDNDAGTLDFALVTGEESGPFAGEVNVNPDGTFEYFFFGNPETFNSELGAYVDAFSYSVSDSGQPEGISEGVVLIAINPLPLELLTGDQLNTEGDQVNLQLEALGSGDVVIENAELPEGLNSLSFISASESIVGSILVQQAELFSPFDVIVTVSDSTGRSEDFTFTWTLLPGEEENGNGNTEDDPDGGGTIFLTEGRSSRLSVTYTNIGLEQCSGVQLYDRAEVVEAGCLTLTAGLEGGNEGGRTPILYFNDALGVTSRGGDNKALDTAWGGIESITFDASDGISYYRADFYLIVNEGNELRVTVYNDGIELFSESITSTGPYSVNPTGEFDRVIIEVVTGQGRIKAERGDFQVTFFTVPFDEFYEGE